MGSGADRVRSLRPNVTLSPLGAKVADLLDAVWDGLYHLPGSLIDRVKWDDPYCITAVVSDHMLATWDSNHLTKLVVLCHDAALRMEISAANPRNVRLSFWQRVREGGTCTRHPTLEQAAADIRSVYRHFLHERTVPLPPRKRDPENDCVSFEIGPASGTCRTDGHPRCVECGRRKTEE